VGAATPERESLAAKALWVSVAAIALPIILVAFVSYAANVVALILAAIAFFMARNAMGTPPLSGAGQSKANWAAGLAVVIALAWIGLVFAGL